MKNKHDTETTPPTFSSFWPIFFISLTIIVFLGWQVSIGVRQYLQGIRISEQQDLVAAQAARVEANFQALMMDVIDLAERSPDVQAVVQNYNIRFTPKQGDRETAAAPAVDVASEPVSASPATP